MRLEIFTPDLSNRHEISHAISSQFSDLYNGIGKFSIVLPMDDYNIGLAQIGALVYIVDRKLCYEVAEVTNDCDANEITLNGYSLNNMLDRRVVANETNIKTVADIYSMMQSNLRDLPVVLDSEGAPTDAVEETNVSENGMLSAVIPVLDSAGLGQKAVFDYKTKTISWKVYKGADRTSGLQTVAFLRERGTAPALVIDQDASEYKNVIYCNAEYNQKTTETTSGGTEVEKTEKIKFTVTVGDAEGAERRETILKFGGDSQSEGESLASFRARVTAWATGQLAELKNRIGFAVNADASELGTAYNVGDLVWCISLRHNVKFKTRITEAQFSQDANGQSISITVGDPILTAKVR